MFKEPGTDYPSTITENIKDNLFNSESLEQYFDLQEFNDFNNMLESIKTSASTDSNKIIIVYHLIEAIRIGSVFNTEEIS